MGLEPLLAVLVALVLAGVVAVRWRGRRRDEWTERPTVAPGRRRSEGTTEGPPFGPEGPRIGR